MCMAPNVPGGGSSFWSSGAPGMTSEEAKALPQLTSEAIAWGGIAGIATLGQERTAAIEQWKTDNPDRYKEGVLAQEQAASGQPQRTQAASNARQGAGGSGGGGASSQNTLLTGAGDTQGVDPSALDLSKNSLLGL